jgi:hypothetical protein
MPAPIPKTPTPTPRDFARQIRRNALPKAAQTLVELLDHQSGTVRLEAATRLMDREEGRPVQAIRVEEASEQDRADRTGLNALFAHLRAVQPHLIEPVTVWLVRVFEGQNAAPPTGLVPPQAGPALDFYSRALAASAAITVEALPQETR